MNKTTFFKKRQEKTNGFHILFRKSFNLGPSSFLWLNSFGNDSFKVNVSVEENQKKIKKKVWQ